mgnify:CR=1 FL=1|jgi:hypothetical protein
MVLLIANKKLPGQEVIMISVGIDVAKGKSTVCILKPYGEIVSKPFDISHVESPSPYIFTGKRAVCSFH